MGVNALRREIAIASQDGFDDSKMFITRTPEPTPAAQLEPTIRTEPTMHGRCFLAQKTVVTGRIDRHVEALVLQHHLGGAACGRAG